MIGYEELLDLEQVKTKTGMSRSTIYGKIRNHGFPRALPLYPKSPGRVRKGWKKKDIDKWIHKQESPGFRERIRQCLRGWLNRLHNGRNTKPSTDNRVTDRML